MHRSAPGEPAPIDNAVLAIWLKRLLLVNSPNMIFRILSPILQAKNVVLVELTENGEKQMSSTAPMVPPTEMATTDPERYAMMKTDHDAYIESCKGTAKTIRTCLKDGGVFSSGP